MIFTGTAFNIVNSYLTKEYTNTTVNESQVKAITQAAFDFLKHKKEPIEMKYRNGEEIKGADTGGRLIDAVRTILISVDTPWKPTLRSDSETQQLFFDLLRGNVPPLMKLLKQPVLLKAIIWKKDPELLREARELVQQMFEDIYAEITSRDQLTYDESLHFEIIIGEILSLLPFLRPEHGKEIQIPIQIDHQWRMANYEIEKIQITPKWMGSPYTSFGLIPKNFIPHDDVVLEENLPLPPPIFLSKGTTFPTDPGFLLSLLMDINPFASVGFYGFFFGKDKIKDRLDEYTDNGINPAINYGKSLGGAQSWRIALYFPDRIAKVMAFGAPGFSFWDKRKLAKIQQDRVKPEINFFNQENDPVPFVDRASSGGVNYYQVLSGKPQKGVLAHAHMYSTHENSTILFNRYFHKEKKWKRLALNLTVIVLSLVVFPIFLSLYVVYNTINQARKFLNKHVIRVIVGKFRNESPKLPEEIIHASSEESINH